jgi:hypothetical protein
MPALAKTSLVGLFPPPNVPGRGDAGESVFRLLLPMDVKRLLVGPIEARALGVLPLPGPGDGDGLVDGGRSVAIFLSLFLDTLYYYTAFYESREKQETVFLRFASGWMRDLTSSQRCRRRSGTTWIAGKLVGDFF